MSAPNFMKSFSSFPESLALVFEDGNILRTQGYRGRFAPTPSGDLHLGNLRTALIAWLRARIFKGKFFLRIDDLDTLRNIEGSAKKIQDDLVWLGLNWDGPTIFQSKRTPIYRSVLAYLKRQGKLYPCICSRRSIARESISGLGGLIYSGKCRYENNSWISENNNRPSLRLKVEKDLNYIHDY